MRLKILKLTHANRQQFAKDLEALENEASYPYQNEDSFKISHGSNYFAFFDRLGELHYFVLLVDEEVVGVGCGIIRRPENGLRPFWYLSDLKIKPAFRGRNFSIQLFLRLLPLHYLRCPRGFAIGMRKGKGHIPAIQKIMTRIPLLHIDVSQTLFIYSFSFAEITAILPLLSASFGRIGFLSLTGIKDLILQSNRQPLPILHVQFGPFAEYQIEAPQKDYVHMLAARAGSQLEQELTARGLIPSAEATLLSHRMGAFPWEYLLTSDL